VALNLILANRASHTSAKTQSLLIHLSTLRYVSGDHLPFHYSAVSVIDDGAENVKHLVPVQWSFTQRERMTHSHIQSFLPTFS